MKSGSGDDPFAEVEERDATGATDDATAADEGDASDDGDEGDADDASAGSAPSIPYKFRRASVKEGRTQRPIFVRPHVEERETDFLRELEDELGEDVYKTDALEAALVVAMNNPGLVADELREWGYDWD